MFGFEKLPWGILLGQFMLGGRRLICDFCDFLIIGRLETQHENIRGELSQGLLITIVLYFL